ADAAVMDVGFSGFLLAWMQAGLRSGPEGWIDDDLAFVKPWGFDPATIHVPTLIWQGEQDLFVPPAHGRWLMQRIPAAERRLTLEDGHLTLAARRVPEVHTWLRSRF